ncbi:MAG: hypothetical protein HOK80_02245, partial [Candidatus Cloacimonetes bacterium]|nr:hypothetical protein [Candidatus Cloacimonadota bacterium]
NSKDEIEISNPENNILIQLPDKGYIRMSLKTENSGVVFTNPVWIQ